MYIGFDLFNNGIPHKDLQIGCHNVEHKIEWGLSDNELKHQLLYGVYKGDFNTRDDINLDKFLTDCKTYNIIPIVDNNGYKLDNMPVCEYIKRCRIIDNILKERGFTKAFLAIMNEPNTATGFNTRFYTDIVNKSKEEVKNFPIIAGNDEFGNLDWNYLLDNGNFDYLGVHPLSSLGYPPNWNRLYDWATMATARGKKYIIIEGGSWFKSYFSLEGWTVIKDMILKAKYYGYEAVCIVALDNNGNVNFNLGFRRFNYTYSILLDISSYWDDFINLVNREGKKYQIEGEEEDMKLDKIYKEGSRGIGVKFIQMVLNRDIKPVPLLKVDSIWGPKTDAIVLDYQIKYGLSQYGGDIGPNTMQDMIKKYPDIWDNIQYLYAIGER